MTRFQGIRRLVIGSTAALLLCGTVALVGGGVASARTVTRLTATGGSSCTTLHPCGSKKGHLPNQYVPPADPVATTAEGSITLSWTPVQEIVPVEDDDNVYTCTLLYGYNNVSQFSEIAQGNSCTFYGLAASTEYGVQVTYGEYPDVSAPTSAFAMTPAEVKTASVTSGSTPANPDKATGATAKAPIVQKILPKAKVGATTLVTIHGQKFYGKVQVWSSSSAITTTVKKVTSKTVVVAVKAASNAKPGTYTLTVVDPNQESASGTFTLK